MHIFEKNIKNLELNIPSMALPIANYVPYKIFNKILYNYQQIVLLNKELGL